MEDSNNKQFNMYSRMKLKRQTKIIISLNESWNNYKKLYNLISLGVDAFEIKSELQCDIKKEIITKIRYLSNETKQCIPIIYNLSYFRIHVSQINETYEEEIQLNKQETIYLVNKSDLTKFRSIEILQSRNLENISNKKLQNKMSLIDIAKQLGKTSKEVNIKEEQIKTLTTSPELIYSSFEPGMVLALNNNEVSIEIKEVCKTYIKCTVISSGIIYQNSSFSIASNYYNKKSANNWYFVEKEEEILVKELTEAVNLKTDYIIISVTENCKTEIYQIREVLEYLEGSFVKIIVNMDNSESVSLFEEYIQLADAIIFSRNEMVLKDNLSRICHNERQIISKCGFYGKFFTRYPNYY